MDWNCTLTEERLSDFMDGALAQAERAALTAHTAECQACGRLVERVGAMVGDLRTLAPVVEPPYLAANILKATLGARAGESVFQRWLGWLGEVGQTRFAMGVATVAISLAILFHVAGPRIETVKASDLSPANVVRRADREVHLRYAHAAKFVNDLRVVYEIQTRFAPPPEPKAARGTQPQSSPIPTEPPDQSKPQPDSTTGGNRGSELAAVVVGSRL